MIAAPEGAMKVEAPEQQATAETDVAGEAGTRIRVRRAMHLTEERVVESAEEPREIARIVLPSSQAESDDPLVRQVGEGATATEPAASERQRAGRDRPAAGADLRRPPRRHRGRHGGGRRTGGPGAGPAAATGGADRTDRASARRHGGDRRPAAGCPRRRRPLPRPPSRRQRRSPKRRRSIFNRPRPSNLRRLRPNRPNLMSRPSWRRRPKFPRPRQAPARAMSCRSARSGAATRPTQRSPTFSSATARCWAASADGSGGRSRGEGHLLPRARGSVVEPRGSGRGLRGAAAGGTS